MFNYNGKNVIKDYICTNKSPSSRRINLINSTSLSKLSDEGCAINQRLKWGPLHPNDVGMIAQPIRKRETQENFS